MGGMTTYGLPTVPTAASFNLLDDKALGDRIRRVYYEGRWCAVYAASQEFVPTSFHRSWMGKYRCMWCKRTGYTWEGCLTYSYWWGHTHGKNCRRRPK